MKNSIVTRLLILPLVVSATWLLRAGGIGEYLARNWGGLPPALKAVRIDGLDAAQRQRLEEHHRQVVKYAPHWLDEYAAMEKFFGWPAGAAEWMQLDDASVLSPPAHECTSWIVTPSHSATRGMILHKNRDATTTSLGLNQMAVPGKYRWIGLGNLGHLAPCMGINERALAVAMNSGSACDEYNAAGLRTPELCRILLEECADGGAAVAKLRQLVGEGAYRHGKRGSIWFIADSEHAYVVEQSATHFTCHEVADGLLVRANSWTFPEMIPFNKDSSKHQLNSFKRELSVRQTLLASPGKIDLPQIAAAARCRQADEWMAPPCHRGTCSASTFVFHPTFPRELTTAWLACGPPAHTVFLPVPIIVGELPRELFDGSFADGAFRRRAQDLMADDAAFVELDGRLRQRHLEALRQAEALLADGQAEAARGVVNQAFQENWREAKAVMSMK